MSLKLHCEFKHHRISVLFVFVYTGNKKLI